MKQIWTFVASTLLSAAIAFAQADQGASTEKAPRFGIGAKAAFDFGWMYGFDEDNLVDEKPTGIGFDVGVMLRVQMIPNLYFAPELDIAYLSASHEIEHLERTYTNVDLEVPLMIRGTVAERFYVTAGPQLSFNLSSDTDFGSDGTIKQCTSTNECMEFNIEELGYEETLEKGAVDFGLAVGAGVNITEGLFFDIRYYLGIKELYDVDSDDIMKGAKAMKVKAGLSYWFI